MPAIPPGALWLMVPIAAVIFMLWVLLNFSKDEVRRLRKYRLSPRPIAENPAPSIEVRDGRSLHTYAAQSVHRSARS